MEAPALSALQQRWAMALRGEGSSPPLAAWGPEAYAPAAGFAPALGDPLLDMFMPGCDELPLLSLDGPEALEQGIGRSFDDAAYSCNTPTAAAALRLLSCDPSGSAGRPVLPPDRREGIPVSAGETLGDLYTINAGGSLSILIVPRHATGAPPDAALSPAEFEV